jgi:hypothetical protein
MNLEGGQLSRESILDKLELLLKCQPRSKSASWVDQRLSAAHPAEPRINWRDASDAKSQSAFHAHTNQGADSNPQDADPSVQELVVRDGEVEQPGPNDADFRGDTREAGERRGPYEVSGSQDVSGLVELSLQTMDLTHRFRGHRRPVVSEKLGSREVTKRVSLDEELRENIEAVHLQSRSGELHERSKVQSAARVPSDVACGEEAEKKLSSLPAAVLAGEIEPRCFVWSRHRHDPDFWVS